MCQVWFFVKVFQDPSQLEPKVSASDTVHVTNSYTEILGVLYDSTAEFVIIFWLWVAVNFFFSATFLLATLHFLFSSFPMAKKKTWQKKQKKKATARTKQLAKKGNCINFLIDIDLCRLDVFFRNSNPPLAGSAGSQQPSRRFGVIKCFRQKRCIF